MNGRQTGRQSLAFIISIGVHVALAAGLILIPRQIKQHWDTVDMSIAEKAPEPEPEPEKKPEKPRYKKKAEPEPPPQEPPPEPEPEPEKEEAPPVFDLGDNTFAGEGKGASWKLNRSEGNTKFAGVAKPGEKSKRGTAPKRAKEGTPNGKGFKPVPLRNLSRRPDPPLGGIKIPPYPSEARREGIEGKVILQVFIGKDGQVKRVRVVKDPGGGLGLAAKNSMMKEKWKPARDKAGKPVDTVIVYSYRFVLEG